jgi:hypothetical protein
MGRMGGRRAYEKKETHVSSSSSWKLSPPIDLGLSAANFFRKLLAQQKLTQLNIEYIMNNGTKLLNKAIHANKQDAIRLIVESKLVPMSAVSSILDCKATPFSQFTIRVRVVQH